MIPGTDVTWTSNASFVVAVPPHPLTQPLVAVVMTNDAAIPVVATVGPIPVRIPPFTSTKLALDGTERSITVTPSDSAPAPGVFSTMFLFGTDDPNLESYQRADKYFPAVRLPLLSITTNNVVGTGSFPFGPFYVGDYEDIVFNFASDNPSVSSWDLSFSWNDQNGNRIGAIDYIAPSRSDVAVMQFLDRLSNMGPYLTGTIGHAAGGLSDPTAEFKFQLAARRKSGANDSGVTSIWLASNETAQAPGSLSFPLFPVRACTASIAWSVSATSWSIFVQALDAVGNNTALLFAASSSAGSPKNGVATIAIPSRFCTLLTTNGDGTSQSVLASIVPLFS